MGHWTQQADAPDQLSYWRRIDGVLLRAGVSRETGRPHWNLLFPTTPPRSGSIPAIATIEEAMTTVDREHPLPSWAVSPGLANQIGYSTGVGSDCEFTACTVREVLGEQPLIGTITLQLVSGGAILRMSSAGQVSIEGQIMANDPWFYRRFRPWLRAHAENAVKENVQFDKEIHIRPGVGALIDGHKSNDGNFIFRMSNGLELLKIRHDGAMLIGGSLMSSDRNTILAALRVWLSSCHVEAKERQAR